MNCHASLDEINHDISQAQLERQGIATATEQMSQVSELAKSFLNGHSLTDLRRSYVFEGPTRVLKLLPVTFGMKQVADLVQEKITPELCLGLYRGEPKALFSVQKIVGDAAHEIAFDALNLESSPFLDYSELKEISEQADEH